MDGRKIRRMDVLKFPRVLQDISLLGPLPKKKARRKGEVRRGNDFSHKEVDRGKGHEMLVLSLLDSGVTDGPTDRLK